MKLKKKALYGFQTGARSGLNLGVGRQRPRNSVGSFGNPHQEESDLVDGTGYGPWCRRHSRPDRRCELLPESTRTALARGGTRCPFCGDEHRLRHGFDSTQKQRQRYHCKSCRRYFDDLTGTIFEGHHQPLRVWILCLYFMGLNLSNSQIARELDLNKDEVQAMALQLRDGIVEQQAGSASRGYCRVR